MKFQLTDLEKAINSGLGTFVKSSIIKFEQLTIEIDADDINEILVFLKNNDKCKFKQLIDITAVDYPEKEKRFQLVYLLLSHENNLRLTVVSNINEKGKVPSIV